MKKSAITFISLAAMAAVSSTSHAQLNGTGYYRITNNYTDRYIYVTDDKGSLNYQQTSADMGAIDLWMGIERTLYDPATVLYCQQISGKQYDIKAQGTGIYEIIGSYVTLSTDPRVPGAYVAYGSRNGLTKYLFDGRDLLSLDWSYLSDVGDIKCKYWKIIPISADGENYFGVKPAVTTSDGEHYASFFAEFPFSFASSGMKACYITKVDGEHGYAVYKEITGTVPGATPLFIKCNSENHSDNRLNIGGNATAVSDNIGVGVYFNNDKVRHENQVAYKPQTMRVLGTMTDGKLALVTGDYDFVPRNTFYVNVPEGTPAELRIVSESEYNEIIASLPVEATGITLSRSALTLKWGESATLTATVQPANATDRNVAWTSSDASVAVVDNNGNVTATGCGTAVIEARCGKVTAKCDVTVVKKTQTITWNQDFSEVYEGDAITLLAEASSGLAIRYEVATDNARVNGNVLTLLSSGEVRVVAHQDGDDHHEAAAPVEMRFNAISGISDAVYDGVSVATDASGIVVKGKPADADVCVYSLTGALVYRGKDTCVALQGHTVYIVVIGDRRFKIITE